MSDVPVHLICTVTNF